MKRCFGIESSCGGYIFLNPVWSYGNYGIYAPFRGLLYVFSLLRFCRGVNRGVSDLPKVGNDVESSGRSVIPC